jgi:hypothetical protein
VNVVATHRGWKWLALGWRLFTRNSLAWTAMVLVYWMLVALLNEIPAVGAAVSTLLLPTFSMSFMLACEKSVAGIAPTIRSVFAGFQHRVKTLIGLGVIYLASIMVVLAVASLADDGILFRWIAQGKPPPQDAVADGTALRGLLVATIVAAPTFMAFWFAPVLVVWKNMGAIQSMFYSFFASLRNWKAFAIYGISVAAGGMIASLIATLIAVAAQGNPMILRVVMMAFTIGILPTLFASFYFSYLDVFADDQKLDPATGRGPNTPDGDTAEGPSET